MVFRQNIHWWVLNLLSFIGHEVRDGLLGINSVPCAFSSSFEKYFLLPYKKCATSLWFPGEEHSCLLSYFLTLYRYFSCIYLVIKNIKRYGYMPEENVVLELLILEFCSQLVINKLKKCKENKLSLSLCMFW